MADAQFYLRDTLTGYPALMTLRDNGDGTHSPVLSLASPDGANAALGATDDPAQNDPTEAATVIQLLKGLQLLLLAQFPNALGQAPMAASLSVVLASDQSALFVQPDGAFEVNARLSPGQANYGPVTIANGQSLSDAIGLVGYTITMIEMPAAWTTAALTFQVSPDGVTYQNAYDTSGAEVTVQAAVSRTILLPPTLFPGAQYLKIRSGTSGTPVSQAAQRVIRVVGVVL